MLKNVLPPFLWFTVYIYIFKLFFVLILYGDQI